MVPGGCGRIGWQVAEMSQRSYPQGLERVIHPLRAFVRGAPTGE